MKLGIDAREIQNGVYTGIGGPLANFLNYFSSFDDKDECILFSSKDIPLDFGKKIRNVVIEEKNTFYWDQFLLPKALEQEAIEIFYSPYYKIPLRSPCLTISAILDLMYFAVDHYRRELSLFKKIYYFTFAKMMAQKANWVLTCSENSKQDIITFYGVDAQKIKVIPLSIDNHYRFDAEEDVLPLVHKKFGIDSLYIFYFGNFKYHKNINRVIKAFKRIIPEFREIKLVLAGPKEHYYLQHQTLVNELSLKDKVMFLGKISDREDARLLYTGAKMFVMPTLYEGFGLPPVEAMACGTPVITSNTSSLPEVMGEAGILVDPYKIDEITTAMRKLLQDKSLCEELGQRGLKQYKNFTEEKIAKQTYAFFKKVWKECQK
ncbi:hypothetical protein MNBD_UNCLBAC01-2031 [hydrothermal vent metagenome]|uniref:Uncharacterized protein n=1 Tax=hydrothermal vent metagenome TaxID=652676 RepID=A0A3B1DN36_9ZZZZ